MADVAPRSGYRPSIHSQAASATANADADLFVYGSAAVWTPAQNTSKPLTANTSFFSFLFFFPLIDLCIIKALQTNLKKKKKEKGIFPAMPVI